jgi:hypothetical protein
MDVCHSEQSEESHQINKLQILHGVYPGSRLRPFVSLRVTKSEGFRMIKRDFLQTHQL